MSFGSLLRARRNEAGLDLQHVAATVGLSIAQLSRIERDREVPNSEDIIRMLATAIGTSEIELRVEAKAPTVNVNALGVGVSALYRRSDRRWTR